MSLAKAICVHNGHIDFSFKYNYIYFTYLLEKLLTKNELKLYSEVLPKVLSKVFVQIFDIDQVI